jgi:hypothetical protein
MFNSVLLPAPEGPRMAVRCPDLKRPLILLRMILLPAKSESVTVHSTRRKEIWMVSVELRNITS